MSAKPMIEAVLKAGLLDKNALEELKRFSPVIPSDAKTEEPKDLDTAATIIARALESEGYVLVRETDLDVLNRYFETAQSGQLFISTEGVTTRFGITYGRTKLGEYIIAWRSESIEELLTNGLSYLETTHARIFFDRVRELFYDETKAFMVCHASTEEALQPQNDAS